MKQRLLVTTHPGIKRLNLGMVKIVTTGLDSAQDVPLWATVDSVLPDLRLKSHPRNDGVHQSLLQYLVQYLPNLEYLCVTERSRYYPQSGFGHLRASNCVWNLPKLRVLNIVCCFSSMFNS